MTEYIDQSGLVGKMLLGDKATELYMAAYHDCGPKHNITSQHLVIIPHLLERDYQNRRIFNRIPHETPGWESSIYLVSGGIVEVQYKHKLPEGILIRHESRKGLEKMAEEMALPKPSQRSILKLTNRRK